MKNHGKIDVAYNRQSAVDSKNKLLLTVDVANDSNDQSQLTSMVAQTNNLLSKSINRGSQLRYKLFLSIYLLHLHQSIVSSSYGTSTSLPALSSTVAFYVISVRQTRDLPPASFRFHVAMDTLAFG